MAARRFRAGVLVHAFPTASRARPHAAVDNRRPPSTEKTRRAAISRASRHQGFL